MKFEIKFDCDNTAFDDDNLRQETNTILNTIAQKVAQGYTSGTVKDSNGNKVGTWGFKN